MVEAQRYPHVKLSFLSPDDPDSPTPKAFAPLKLVRVYGLGFRV